MQNKKKVHTLNGAVNKRMILFSHFAPCFIPHFCRQQPEEGIEEEGYEAEYYQEFESNNMDGPIDDKNDSSEPSSSLQGV